MPSSQVVKSMILIDTDSIQLCVYFPLWRSDMVDVMTQLKMTRRKDENIWKIYRQAAFSSSAVR